MHDESTRYDAGRGALLGFANGALPGGSPDSWPATAPDLRPESLRILHLEHDVRDRRIVHDRLVAEGIAIGELVVVDNRADFVAALERGGFDVVLAAYSVPGFEGLEALRIARATCPDVPFIFVTGAIGEDRAIETLKCGATDYVLKERLVRLALAVRRAVAEAAERTMRHQAEARVRSNERWLRMALEAAQSGTWEWDVQTDATTWSEELWGVYGLKPESLQPSFDAWLEILDPADRPRVEAQLRGRVKEGAPIAVEFRIRGRDGGTRWLLLSGQPFVDPETNSLRYRGIVLDITERKRVEEENERLLKRAVAASRLKDEFLTTLSHELRTPLNAIVGWAQMLGGSGLSSERAAHAIEVIRRNASAQARLIDDILDVSAIINGKLRIEPALMDLGAIIGAAVESVRHAADAKGISIVFEPSRAPLFGDANRLQQVFWNLLSNAVKFTPGGGGVSVVIGHGDACIHVTVSDTGIGIPPDFLPHVFERFAQGDPSRSREFGGLGLGLALVRHLVELHGGAVTAESDGEGRGARFHVQLPVRTVVPRRVEPESARRPADETCGEMPKLPC